MEFLLFLLELCLEGLGQFYGGAFGFYDIEGLFEGYFVFVDKVGDDEGGAFGVSLFAVNEDVHFIHEGIVDKIYGGFEIGSDNGGFVAHELAVPVDVVQVIYFLLEFGLSFLLFGHYCKD